MFGEGSALMGSDGNAASSAEQSPNELSPVELDQISPVAQDYVKQIWASLEWGGEPTSTSVLASRFQTSAPNVSETLRRLARQGLVTYEPYKPVALTERGRAVALMMVRRHRLIETYLVESLGYTWDEVHEDAERLEHAASARFVDRIDALLGHPRMDPHGDPIPGPDLSMPAMDDVAALAELGPGTYEVVRIADDDPQLLRRLESVGVQPGARVAINDAGAGVAADGSALSEAELAAMYVRPATAASDAEG